MRFSMKTRLYNNYDYYLILLLAFRALGGLGGLWGFTRLLEIFLLPQMLLRVPYTNNKYKTYFEFLIFFTFYCFISLIWTPSNNEAPRDFLILFFDFVVFFEILVFSNFAKKPIESISLGWFVAVLLTLVVALWEITTDNHLSISKQQSGMELRDTANNIMIMHRFASVTFNNYNTYVTFLCFALPFVFYIISIPKQSFLQKYVGIGAIVLSSVCILFNASRGGLLTIVIMTIVYFLRSTRNRRGFISISVLLIFAVSAYAWFGEDLFSIMALRSTDGALYEDETRFSLWSAAWQTFISTGGFGTGIGGLEATMRNFSHGITVPHNMFLEVLTEFGALVFFFFMRFVISLFFRARKVLDRERRTLVYIAYAAMPLYTIIDSVYLFDKFVFAAFASLAVFADNSYKTQIIHNYKR